MAAITSIISIEGMTCQSCVRNIESVVSGLHGVHSVKVDLAAKQGTVVHNPQVTTGDQIAERIDDMGFEAKLINRNETLVSIDGNQLVLDVSGHDFGGTLDGNVRVANLLGEPPNCVCGDQLIQLSIKGKSTSVLVVR